MAYSCPIPMLLWPNLGARFPLPPFPIIIQEFPELRTSDVRAAASTTDCKDQERPKRWRLEGIETATACMFIYWHHSRGYIIGSGYAARRGIVTRKRRTRRLNVGLYRGFSSRRQHGKVWMQYTTLCYQCIPHSSCVHILVPVYSAPPPLHA